MPQNDLSEPININEVSPYNLMILKEFLICATTKEINKMFKNVDKNNTVNPEKVSFSDYKKK